MKARTEKKTGPASCVRNATRVETPGVRVRMYDVGFGDCFLLFIPTRDGQRKVLIDCGSIAARKKSSKEIVGQTIADVTDEDGKARIDIVVATHRHRDHISGFADRRWNDVEVKEVWMPWTEALDDPDARHIRQEQARLAAALHATFLRMNADQELIDLAFNALTNEDAMDVLHHGFAGAPLRRLLPGRQQHDRILRTDLLPGVFVHVLGTSHDEDMVRDMEPPADQSYLRLADDGTDDGNLPDTKLHFKK